MSVGTYTYRLASRLPFAALLVAFSYLALGVGALLVRTPYMILVVLSFLGGFIWVQLFEARLRRLGVSRPWPWAVLDYAVLLILTYFQIRTSFSTGPLLVPGFFALLHVPLLILKDKERENAGTVH